MFIYVIVCSETLKIYIGQHKGNNLQKYLQQKISHAVHGEAPGSHLYRAMRKYPRDVWSIHSLISDLSTREECDYWERVLIKATHVQHIHVGYNLGPGGESAPIGNQHGHGNKGKHYPKSEAFRQQVSQKLKGRKMPPEAVRKSIETRRGRPHQITPEGRMRMATMAGKTHSEEWKQQQARRMQGFQHSEESKQKMQKPKSSEALANMTMAQQQRRQKQTHCKHGHELIEGNFVLSRLPHHICLTCARQRIRNHYWSHKL